MVEDIDKMTNDKLSGVSIDRKKILTIAVIIVCIQLCGVSFYANYVKNLIKEESSEHLLSTFNQINNTFSLFTERNWNYLRDWDNNMQVLSENGDVETAWKDFCSTNNWNYSEMYLYNEEGRYVTVSGNKGTSENITEIFANDYEKGEPIATSYYGENGTRKAVFALDLTTSVLVDGIEYTGIAVSYENTDLESMLIDNVYDGLSDCYIVAGNGTVLLSLEPKTEFKEHISNMYEFWSDNLDGIDFSIKSMVQSVENQQTGVNECGYQGKNVYVVYQQVGINDWSIVGIVDKVVVDSSMQQILYITVIVLIVLCLIGFGLVVFIVISIAKGKITQQNRVQDTLKYHARMSHQLFTCIAQIVERYFVVDFVDSSYIYREQLEKKTKYPAEGRYEELIEYISRNFVVISDNSKVKVGSMLSENYLKRVMKKDGDMVKFEYASRDNTLYKQMYVLPFEWNPDGEVSKIVLVSMDIGKRVELENLANRDGLTGLFNERYFSSVLFQKEKEKSPFTLFYLDLDRFKPVNDTYGHDIGDKLLKGVSERILSCIRDKDYAFRIGGDEYAIIVNADMGDERRADIVKDIKAAITKPFAIDGNEIRVGTSCGYAVYPYDTDSVEEIRILADKRMYADKEVSHRFL